jgi:hypothetical protein
VDLLLFEFGPACGAARAEGDLGDHGRASVEKSRSSVFEHVEGVGCATKRGLDLVDPLAHAWLDRISGIDVLKIGRQERPKLEAIKRSRRVDATHDLHILP